MDVGTIARDAIDDIPVALRTMRRSPGFVVTAVIVLALGCAITGAACLMVVGVIAAWWPARQAARVEPAHALRNL